MRVDQSRFLHGLMAPGVQIADRRIVQRLIAGPQSFFQKQPGIHAVLSAPAKLISGNIMKNLLPVQRLPDGKQLSSVHLRQKLALKGTAQLLHLIRRAGRRERASQKLKGRVFHGGCGKIGIYRPAG